MLRRIMDTLSPVLLTLLLFASCDKDECTAAQQTSIDSDEKIRFEITVGTATATSSGAQTRVETDDNLNCTFQSGDKIGVFIVKGDAGVQASDNYVHNLGMTFNGTGWSPDNDIYYPTGNEQIHVYAYYPYQPTADPTHLTLSVQSDQRTQHLSQSHLMKASRLNVSRSSNPVVLNFEHLAALVELSVISGAGAGEKMSEAVTVTLEGCKPQLDLNISTGATTVSGMATAITMYRKEQPGDANYGTSYTYRALVPAQTAAANAELFKLAQGVRRLGHKPVNAVLLEAGKTKPYGITLRDTSAAHEYVVGDYYPYTGFAPVLGVVFEVSNGGQHGKIMSLDMERYAWGPENITTDAINNVNGRENMNQIHSNYNIADYAAFDWVHRKNPPGTTYGTNATGIWYLPAIDELVRLYEAYNGGQGTSEATPGARAAFNAKLWEAGGQVLTGTYSIWSSTESFQTSTYVLNYDGSTTSNLKAYPINHCRAIMTF